MDTMIAFPCLMGFGMSTLRNISRYASGKRLKENVGGLSATFHICFSFKITYLFVSRKYNSVHLFTQSRSKRYLFTSDEQMKARVNLTQAFVNKRIHIRYGWCFRYNTTLCLHKQIEEKQRYNHISTHELRAFNSKQCIYYNVHYYLCRI